MLFPKLSFETVMQVDDKLRLDATRSFANDSENITDVLIEPEAGNGFISVYNNGNTSKWYLDWAYETDGFKDVSVRIVADSGDKTKTYMAAINVLDENYGGYPCCGYIDPSEFKGLFTNSIICGIWKI